MSVCCVFKTDWVHLGSTMLWVGYSNSFLFIAFHIRPVLNSVAQSYGDRTTWDEGGKVAVMWIAYRSNSYVCTRMYWTLILYSSRRYATSDYNHKTWTECSASSQYVAVSSGHMSPEQNEWGSPLNPRHLHCVWSGGVSLCTRGCSLITLHTLLLTQLQCEGSLQLIIHNTCNITWFIIFD